MSTAAPTLVPATATEFSLLRYFLLNCSSVLSKDQILQSVWDYSGSRAT